MYDVRENYFALLQKIYHAQKYYQHYGERSGRIDAFITAVSILTASGAVAGWWIWEHAPSFWAILIAASQVLSLVQFLLPYSKRKIAANYITADLSQLFIDLNHGWRLLELGHLTEDQTLERIAAAETRLNEIEQKYSCSGDFPDNTPLRRKADRDLEAFLKYEYSTEVKPL